MLEATAGKKNWERLKSVKAAAKTVQARIFTQLSAPSSPGCDSLSPCTSQGSPPSLQLQSLALVFLLHLSLSSSSFLFPTYRLTFQPPAHPSLCLTTSLQKYLGKPTNCDFLSPNSPAGLYYLPSHDLVYIKCKSFGMGTIYPFTSMSYLLQ